MRFQRSILSNQVETRFPAHFHNAADAIASVRASVERDFSALVEEQSRLLRLALNEAEAIALQTGFPELLFPILAQEKAVKVAAWHERQKSVRQSRPVHAFAA